MKSNKLMALLGLLMVAGQALAAFEQCAQHFPGVTPVLKSGAPAGLRELCFKSFAVLHAGATRTPWYVVERLNRDKILDAKDEVRTDVFYEEERLPKGERGTLTAFSGSGMDRGHLAPAADMSDRQSMAQSFSLANIVPQAPQMNRKAWAGVEKATRRYVQRAQGDVFVFTGPAFLEQRGWIGRGRDKVAVPSHLYKLVYDATTHRAWAHFMANDDAAQIERPIAYADLVRLVGIDFLPGIDVRQ